MPGMPGMPGQPGMPGFPPGMDPGMMPPGMPGMEQAQPELPPMISKLRVVMVTDKGQIASTAWPIDLTQEVADGWYRVAIPLSKFGGPAMADATKLEQVAIFGDVDEYMWVARVQMVSETPALKAEIGPNMTVKLKQDVSFTAAPQAEGVQARYNWDFDDWDGISEDATGRSTTWKFMEEGFYTVTLTVTDPSNQKIPQVAHVDVWVKK